MQGHDGVLEHSELLNSILKNAKRHQRSVVIVLLDLKNAFGEVQHNLIRSSLRYHHVPEAFVQIFDSIYGNFQINISCNGELSEKIKVNKGVLQGDPCSPLLFNLCFDSLMLILGTPMYTKMGYIWGNRSSQQCNWLQYADDAAIVAKDQKSAQGLANLFESWCQWSRMSIRLDKCCSFGMIKKQAKTYSQILPNISFNVGNISAIPLGGHFIYLGRLFDANLDEGIVKNKIISKMETMLKIISNLNVKPQIKLKIFSQYLPSQFSFELKIYNLPKSWIAEKLDALCVRVIRDWIEAPISSCVKEWLITPPKKGGLGIPSFQHRAERLNLQKRNSLKHSKSENIRDLWTDTCSSNIESDSLLGKLPFNQAKAVLKNQQTTEASHHFLNLGVQGLSIKSVLEVIPEKQISAWSQSLNDLSGYLYNFIRKAIQSQLPTFSNLHRWGRSPSALCPLCGQQQTNKHVLSNCGANSALNRYTIRHNQILQLLIDWLSSKLSAGNEIYHDLPVAGSKHISDLFIGLRPDIVIKNTDKISILELTICHETNLISSRNYKLNKYKNIKNHCTEQIKHLPIHLYTCEVSTLGFVRLDNRFTTECGLPSLDSCWFNRISKTAINESFEIYSKRNA